MENEDTTKALTVKKQDASLAVSVDDSVFNTYLDSATFNQTWRAAQLLSKTDLLPAHYKGKPENCFLAFTMARQVGANPFTFMQKTYVVSGKLGMESQLIISLVNNRGPFTGPIQWRFEGVGKARKCIAYATHRQTKEVCEAEVSWAMVEAEGWNKKAGSKWLTMPDIMLRYRSASFLASLYCPEVKLGMPSAEELEDMSVNLEEGKKDKPVNVSELEDRLTKKVDAVVTDSVPTPEEPRYFCKKCSIDIFEADMKGKNKNLCPECLSDKEIIDRDAAKTVVACSRA